MADQAYGTMAVDWEQRTDFDRLRRERLQRATGAPEQSELGRAAVLRHGQHPLHHRDPHRDLGDGQARPILPAHPRRRADPLGLRVGGATPQALQPVARRGTLAAGDLDAARVGQEDAPKTSREKIRVELELARPARRAGRRRHDRAAGAVRASAGRHHRRRRAGADAGRAQDQDASTRSRCSTRPA